VDSIYRSDSGDHHHALHGSDRDADTSIFAATNQAKGVTPMFSPRYIVFDDTPQDSDLTPDQFAAALRAPLAAVGVRVVRQRRARPERPIADFQARGCSRRQYEAKLSAVYDIVSEIKTH
jgi:hypothetical protein